MRRGARAGTWENKTGDMGIQRPKQRAGPHRRLGRSPSDLGSFLLADLRPREAAEAPAPRPSADDSSDDIARPGGVPAPLPLVPTGAWVLSVCVHLALAGSLAVLVARMTVPGDATARPASSPARPTVDEPLFVDLQPRVEGMAVRDVRPPRPADSSAVTYPSGAQPPARPDTTDGGRGGTREASTFAINLAARADDIALDKDPLSRVDRSQVQRLDSAPDRASLDDRRATIQPMEVTFLASGDGKEQSRRPLAETDPSRGAVKAPPAAVLGALPGAAPLPEGERELRRDPGAETAGVDRTSPGMGLLGAREGTIHRAAADAAFARPWVTEGRPAVPADRKDRTRDNVESVQEVASLEQALLVASTPGGERGKGVGGEDGPGKPAAGGAVGVGTRTLVLGQGTGPLVDLDGNDPRLSDYRRRIMAKIHPLWANAFPQSAALEGKQGVAIISLTINADGSVTQVAVARGSTVDEFDENVRRAVLRAAPFPPLPPELSARSMRWAIRFDARNPAVR